MHPILFNHYSLTAATTDFSISSDLLNDFMLTIALTPMGKKLANFAWVNCDLVIRIVVQGQSFAGGKIVVAAHPCFYNAPYATASKAPAISKTNFCVVPHLDLDPSTNQTYELRLPCISPYGKYSLSGVTGSWAVKALVINALISGTATVPAAGLCMYVYMDNVKLDGLTLYSNAFVEEKKPLPSDYVKGAANVSRIAGSAFPAISPYTTLFSMVADAAGSVLSFFGFAKARATENIPTILSRFNDNWSHNKGRTTAIVLASSQENSLGLHPSLGGASGDDMMLSKIMSIYGYIKTFNVTLAMGSGSVIGKFPVNPTWNGNYTAGAVQWTPLAGCLLPFTYWCGDLTYKFEVRCSIFHRCTVLIAWDPKGDSSISAPTLNDAIETLMNTTMVVSGNTECEVVIPYKQLYPYRVVDATTQATTMCNGAIYLYVINELTSNGSTDNIYMNVYVKSDNMFAAVPNSLPLNKITRLVPFSKGIVSKKVGTIVPYSSDVKISFGNKTDLSKCALQSFGESFHSVKDITSKMSMCFIGQHTTLTAQHVAITMPNLPLVVSDQWTAGSPAGGVYRNYLGWFAGAFVGYRGSINYAFHANGRDIHDHYWMQNGNISVTSAENPTVWIAEDDSFVTYCGFRNGFANSHRGITPSADCCAPSFYPLAFTCPRQSASVFPNGVAFAVSQNAPSATVSTYRVYTSSGDDAVFCNFIGFPTTAT